MVWSHETNDAQQNRITMVEMEATHHPTQRQTEEAMDGRHQGGRRNQRINTGGDGAISAVRGLNRVENFVTDRAIGLPVLRYKVQVHGLIDVNSYTNVPFVVKVETFCNPATNPPKPPKFDRFPEKLACL